MVGGGDGELNEKSLPDLGAKEEGARDFLVVGEELVTEGWRRETRLGGRGKKFDEGGRKGLFPTLWHASSLERR